MGIAAGSWLITRLFVDVAMFERLSLCHHQGLNFLSGVLLSR
uniref:Uncharacterized protein n=2 Tax=Pseudomonas TaxID=286 RepID=A0A2L1KIW6_PSEAI|nr:Hypothetical protein [Pseudomonas putida]AVE20669.1 Hypothetical protein [Pseudomonas aeruginosa]AVE21799.1 Hypothetical protein [Pseudomonas aeruginosa]AVE22282.1 Hypothetical protein [Pseudomonas aeruginosa]UGK55963.1 Hypothetical protein [Pseudomonas aeruginosa]